MKEIVQDDLRVGTWVCERTDGEYTGGVGIGLEENGELIAGVLFDNYNGRSISMHVAATGKRWMNKAYLFACFHYPFMHLKVNKIIGLVDSTNLEAQRFDEHLGFSKEALIRDAGKIGDLIIYSMTRPECRFLKG